MADQLVRATAANGGIRVVGVIATELTQEAKERHQLSYVATAALGRTMAGGLLLASSMKKQGSRLNLRFRGNGPMVGWVVDAGRDGKVRGYVYRPDVELPLNAAGKLDVGGAVGIGLLNVMRDTGYGEPHSSTVELVSGEVGEDLTYYLATSEQTPSALMVGVYLDAEQDQVAAAGGLLIQIMPKVARDMALVELLESRIAGLQSFTTMLRSGQTLEDMMASVLGDLDLKVLPDTLPVQFHCPCTKERSLAALQLLGEAELEDMIKTDGEAETTCHFCNTKYIADEQDLRNVIEHLRSQA
jgi:molecular chaperone Hsp33